jgi:hypothetical protein
MRTRRRPHPTTSRSTGSDKKPSLMVRTRSYMVVTVPATLRRQGEESETLFSIAGRAHFAWANRNSPRARQRGCERTPTSRRESRPNEGSLRKRCRGSIRHPSPPSWLCTTHFWKSHDGLDGIYGRGDEATERPASALFSRIIHTHSQLNGEGP